MKNWLARARSSVAKACGVGSRWWGRLSPDDLLPYSLAVLAAALTVWIAFELALPAKAQLAQPASAVTGRPVEKVAGEDRNKVRQYLTALTRRPLFKPIQARSHVPRRTSPQKQVPAVSTQADDIELMGVIGGETPEALIRNRRSGKTYTVTVGQVIGDMTVKEISPRSIILQIGKSEVRIEL